MQKDIGFGQTFVTLVTTLMISNKEVFNDLCGQIKTQPKEIIAYDKL